MLRRIVIVALFVLSADGCAAENTCTKKLALLEAEMADLRQQQQQSSKKIEELQIQLSVLKRRSGQEPAARSVKVAGPGSAQPAAEEAEGLDENQIAELLSRSVDVARRGRFPESLKELDQFIERFGDHPLVAQARLERGKLALSFGETSRALADFSALVNDFPDSPLCAQALLLAGNGSEKLGDMAGAKNYYLQLVQAFPLSAEAAQANKRLEAIR